MSYSNNKLTTVDSPFNRIPAELRNRIYEFALTQPCDIIIGVKSAPPTFYLKNDGSNKHSLSLAQTCKAIWKECRQLFFAVNAFYIRLQPAFNGLDYKGADTSTTVRPLKTFLEVMQSEDLAAMKILKVELIPSSCEYLYSGPMTELAKCMMRVLRTSSKLARSKVPIELKLTLDCYDSSTGRTVALDVCTGYNDGGFAFRAEYEKREADLMNLAQPSSSSRDRLQRWKVEVFGPLEAPQEQRISE